MLPGGHLLPTASWSSSLAMICPPLLGWHPILQVWLRWRGVDDREKLVHLLRGVVVGQPATVVWSFAFLDGKVGKWIASGRVTALSAVDIKGSQ